ncbi:very short patch repair endonuclease [Phenylobacterium sp. 58.2.17]|uniref:very short patch repair endonuclease n=1 Tax=Phenylobacterium sp. 58.2.17 TaxID=2969306 RepID=UPI00226418C4|nr:very short patch repair endonuclease [Phenylobacterium sp. 58.2.17]MCX7584912.1 very short patch repair endonuclease [Phenylobacterium sp. 58.2.17]
MDGVDPARSALMRRVRREHSTPELIVRRELHGRGLRYRLHVRSLPGSPDLVFPSRRAVVFVHGCFWHRHPGCRATTMPRTRQAFWTDKFERNVERDAKMIAQLKAAGWNVHIVWECETKTGSYLGPLLAFLHVPR